MIKCPLMFFFRSHLLGQEIHLCNKCISKSRVNWAKWKPACWFSLVKVRPIETKLTSWCRYHDAPASSQVILYSFWQCASTFKTTDFSFQTYCSGEAKRATGPSLSVKTAILKYEGSWSNGDGRSAACSFTDSVLASFHIITQTKICTTTTTDGRAQNCVSLVHSSVTVSSWETGLPVADWPPRQAVSPANFHPPLWLGRTVPQNEGC